MTAPLASMTYAEWQVEALRRFGSRGAIRFVCPSCGHVASVDEWLKAGAEPGEIGFSCIGRRLGADDANTFRNKGGPCQYAGGGLFRINPQPIVLEGGKVEHFFALAPVEEVEVPS